jgi:hypothetical protein
LDCRVKPIELLLILFQIFQNIPAITQAYALPGSYLSVNMKMECTFAQTSLEISASSTMNKRLKFQEAHATSSLIVELFHPHLKWVLPTTSAFVTQSMFCLSVFMMESMPGYALTAQSIRNFHFHTRGSTDMAHVTGHQIDRAPTRFFPMTEKTLSESSASI